MIHILYSISYKFLGSSVDDHKHQSNVLDLRLSTYPKQIRESVPMTLWDCFVVFSGMSSIAIHNKGDMLGYWTCRKNVEEEIQCTEEDFPPDP